jgi:hypothetical protein
VERLCEGILEDHGVTDCGVIEHLPDLGHWGLDSDLLFKGLRN